MKIAIITPGFLPVPAKYGGAIEELIQNIIDQNEIIKKIQIDLYSVNIDRNETYKYKYTNFIEIKTNVIDKILSVIYNRFFLFLSIFDKNKKEDYISPYAINIKRKLLFRKYDRVIVENNLTVVNALHKKKNLIYHLHNDIGQIDKPLLQCKKMLKLSTKVITISNFMKSRLLSLGTNKNIDVLENAIDFELFDYNKYKDSKFNENKFYFFYSGRIVPEKGVLELVKAFKVIAEIYDNVELIILGSAVFGCNNKTAYEEKIIKEVESIKEKIKFEGFVTKEKIPFYLSKANCVIIPTIINEAFGIVALEAMAMRKIVIATDSGALPEIVDLTSNFIIDKNNIEAELIDKMIYVIENYKQLYEKTDIVYKNIKENKKYNLKNYYTNFLNYIEIGE